MAERQWYRSTINGERGYLTEVNGRQVIRLDRPDDTMPRTYDSASWQPEAPRKPLNKATVAQVTLAADVALCRGLGLVKLAGRKWNTMSDAQRIEWIQSGPDKHFLRKRIYKYLTTALQGEYED
jgi:hypothetical protein